MPLVSICIPTFNGAKWIAGAIQSALAQSYHSLEILVVDDQSTDDTVSVVRGLGDERVTVRVNATRLGLVGNWNQCVRLAKGELIKFLFQDDLLSPDCVAQMVDLFASHPRLGLAFSPRTILLEDPDDPKLHEWKRGCGILHTRFGRLERINDGRDLFRRYLKGGFQSNWIGEPSCVMLRRQCFERIGYFDHRIHQCCDYEMWIRILFHYDVGFIHQPLSTFRIHSKSTTSANETSNRAFLDGLWLLEGLLADDEIRRAHPEIARLRRGALLRVGWTELQRLLRGHAPSRATASGLVEYARFRAERQSLC